MRFATQEACYPRPGSPVVKLIGFDTSGQSTDEARIDGKVFRLVKRHDKKRALPLFAVFFVVKRFVVWTAQKVQWPQEVVDALGVLITEEDLKADATHQLRPA